MNLITATTMQILQHHYCDQCNNPITSEWAFIRIDPETQRITYLCSIKCRHIYRKTKICIQCNTKFYTIHKAQQCCSRTCFTESRKISCEHCGKRFIGVKIKGRQLRKYCSRACYIIGKKGATRLKRYTKYNYCERCNKWILKTDSIIIPKGSRSTTSQGYTTKRDNCYCPICSYRLVAKKVRPKIIKYIE